MSEAVAGHGLRSSQHPLRLSRLPGLQVGLWGCSGAQPPLPVLPGRTIPPLSQDATAAPPRCQKHVALWQQFS